jgi:hypothetical protein
MDQDLKQNLEEMEGRIVSTLHMHLNEVCENVGTKLRTEFWERGVGTIRLSSAKRPEAKNKQGTSGL